MRYEGANYDNRLGFFNDVIGSLITGVEMSYGRWAATAIVIWLAVILLSFSRCEDGASPNSIEGSPGEPGPQGCTEDDERKKHKKRRRRHKNEVT